MNYYKRHLGDYARDTGHLSALEHGIYGLLLDWYYINERPIPPEKAIRIAKGNRTETETVLSEFFVLCDEGWRHARADREIAEYRARAETNRVTGKLGGRPRKTETVSERKPNRNQNVTLATSHKPQEDQKIESANADSSTAAPVDPGPGRPKACPQQKIVDLYHEVLPELRRVREWNPMRQKLLARRWLEHPERQTLDWWRDFFGYVRKSRFLMGQTQGRDGRPFDCDLEWLVRPTNFVKVVEGRYEDADGR